ncbi:hypothetical protein DFA_08684 [Cavenderia fasciculata]|uniref:Ankyrin repeat-containing protein n=1 Tax=Cavenderia fasciculata TaxID=261658 RepID=F4Q3N0_CACFS|nr:uncharacterized protein DFA_08684 [Cavenderia fasciculata]EGG17688.1 hypothetical protein DFA_08684 [Cavenderia fasciculata]|eukprot:XP_004356172.1 hypothetical protein DFA_08684 [Cavenderia fasciculata]
MNNNDNDNTFFSQDVFRKVFKSKVLVQCIFKQVRIHRLEYLGDGSLPADPMRMYRYKDIKSANWMIRNGYLRLLKHKLVHRHLTTLLDSNDAALLCETVTEQDIDVFDYIYFKYSHLFLCYTVVLSAASNPSTSHPLKLILSRTQQDGGYAMWNISGTLRAAGQSIPCTSFLLDRLGMIMSGQLQDPLFLHSDKLSARNLGLLDLVHIWLESPCNLQEMAPIMCRWIQQLPPNLPFIPNVILQRFPIQIAHLSSYYFHLPLDVFKIVFEDSLGRSTTKNNLSEAQLVKCTHQYLCWLGTVPFGHLFNDDDEVPPPLPDYHHQSLFEALKQIQVLIQQRGPNSSSPLTLTLGNIEMIEYIESKLANHSGQYRKGIMECMVDKVTDEKEYKWVYVRWMVESGRILDIREKNKWVQRMIQAAVVEQREPELLLLLSDQKVRDNVNWMYIYYRDYNPIIQREIKKANPTTQFVTCPDELLLDNNDNNDHYYNQEYYQQNNRQMERVINRAIQGGHLHFIKKIYLDYDPSFNDDARRDIYIKQLNFLTKAAQYNQFKIAKWLIEKIKSDRFEYKPLKVKAMQTALEVALLYGHSEITDLILSQVPKDYIFSFSLLRVVAISGNLEFFRAITKFVDKDYTDQQMQPTLVSAVQSGSIELVQYIINDLLKWCPLSFPFILIPDAIRYGHFDIVKYFLVSIRFTPEEMSNIARCAINYSRYQVIDHLVQKCGYQLSQDDIRRAFSIGIKNGGSQTSLLQYIISCHGHLYPFKLLESDIKKNGIYQHDSICFISNNRHFEKMKPS